MVDERLNKIRAFLTRYTARRGALAADRLKSIRSLLGSFRRTAESYAASRVADFRARFVKLNGDFAPAFDKYKEALKSDAPAFNVFDYFDLKETRHSQLLADLLNPRGSHAQGDTFLKGFLSVVRGTGAAIAGTDKVLIQREKSVTESGGRVDIFVESFPPDPFVVVIENKIEGAPDQPGQLDRYSSYGLRANKPVYVVYVTISGDEPAVESLSDETRAAIIKGRGRVVPLSCRDIERWLTGALASLRPPHLNATLNTYCRRLAGYY